MRAWANFTDTAMTVRQAMCARDEGRPLVAGLRRQAANHRKRLWSKVTVVSVTEKAGLNLSGVKRKDERK